MSAADPLRTLASELHREEMEQAEFERSRGGSATHAHSQSHSQTQVQQESSRFQGSFRSREPQSPQRGSGRERDLHESQGRYDSRPAGSPFGGAFRNDLNHSIRSAREPSQSQQQSNFGNAELRALSESMRSINMPSGGGVVGSGSSEFGHSTRSLMKESTEPSEFCRVCELEEQNMNPIQRKNHHMHQQQQQQQQQQPYQQSPYQQGAWLEPYSASASTASYAGGYGPPIHHPHSHPPPSHMSQPAHSPRRHQQQQPQQPQQQSSSNLLGAFGMNVGSLNGDESLLYSNQPSRAVLSALRSLQDKLQELRVEKSQLENSLVRMEQDSAAREYEANKKLDTTIREHATKLAELESNHMARMKDAREKEEKLNSSTHKLENEVRMLKDQALSRESDLKNLRDEMHHLRLKVNDAELGLAKAQSEVGVKEREVELEHAFVTEKDLEINRLKNEVNKVASNLHSTQQQVQQAHAALEQEHEARQREEQRAELDRESMERLTKDLKIVSKDLLQERAHKQILLQYKYLTRDYITSLLNLNYELSIDAGMSVRKRNDLLKHSSDLLHGLKKHAWSLETELVEQVMEETTNINGGDKNTYEMQHIQTHNGGDGNGTKDDALSSYMATGGFSLASPQKNMVINGVHTSIDEQKYLLASASSPEAIRVVHGEARGGSYGASDNDSDSCSSHGGDGSDSDDDRPVRIRVPTTPTVASTIKAGNPTKRRATALAKSTAHCHTLHQQREIALPYTIGRSTKQSFSVPVNVQEILSKQPSYYSKVASKQLASSRRRSVSGASLVPGPVEEERIIVQPPPPAPSNSAASTSNIEPPEPISLAAHSVGLATVIQHMEDEIETLNRDYIYHLDHSRRDGDQDKQILQKKLQTILKTIEKKTKQVDLLKQHQESVQGNHGVRLYSASTIASRNFRAASSSQKKSSAPSTSRSNASSRSSSVAPSARRATTSRPKSALTSSSGHSHKKKRTVIITASTDLTDRHAHHQHGTQTRTPVKSSRVAEDEELYSDVPQLRFASPSSQRLLEKKIKSMRLLGQFKEIFGSGQDEGEAAKRFGSD